MRTTTCLAAALLSFAAALPARAQPLPPPPPVYVPAPPPVYVPAPPPPRFYAPRPYYAPRPVYRPVYVTYPMNPYAVRARILRGIGIPLLSIGVLSVIGGGVVAIVGAACTNCSPNVETIGFGLLGAGAGVLVTGAILLGVGNYYRWAARFASRGGIGLAMAPGNSGAVASLSYRF